MNQTFTRISLLVRIVIVCFLIFIAAGCSSDSAPGSAQQFYAAAQLNDSQYSFTVARPLYARARTAFLAEGNLAMADQCRNAIQRISLYEQTYPYTEDQLRSLLAARFPTISASRIDGWFADGSSLEHVTIDGVARYMSDPPITANIKYRNRDLFWAEGDNKNFVEWLLTHYVNQPRPGPFEVYTNPKTFNAKGTLAVPRANLPEDGTLRIWIPLPIVAGPQQSVTINSIIPAVYLKLPPGGEDLGLAYMEIPLDELAGDLNISVDFTFTHYEQHFTVDPALIGTYDKADSDYIRYTRSYGNTTITPEIRETALRVVGGETNPYLAAKKLYDYVIANITYSLPPATLWPYGTPASVYVHTHRIGDCGCQSMYFTALCRSIGIPARTTGGKQMMNRGEYSDHFWGEFYLPNYGWVPVDTSIAQLEFYATGLSEDVRKSFRDYFFGHQDNLRLVFQKDVDIPVFPPLKGGILYMPGAIQNPDGTCETMNDDIMTGELIQKYWTLVEKPYVGWAIGNDPENTAVILHTDNSGMTWKVEGDMSLWKAHYAGDISAVDKDTAWAALGPNANDGGMILHTRDGGSTWKIQVLPQTIPTGVKGIKGVSPDEAWAVGLNGPVLHTNNGGETWQIVPTPGVTLRQVNRIDALGGDIWIADHGHGENGMIHSADGGVTWRQEYLPGVDAGNGPMTASIVNKQVAWTSINMQGELYRTTDSGLHWKIDAPDLSGPNDIDDVCAVSADEAWAVQNTSGGGYVMRVKIVSDDVIKSGWYFPDYVYEGVSAFDGQLAWIGGYRGMSSSVGLPKGSILHTNDGGVTWTSQTLPVSNVDIWKISFVGAHR